MPNLIWQAIVVCALYSLSAVLVADESPGDSLLPDFYNDPALSTSGIELDDYESSEVDYFSGMMSRSAMDFSLPGNGGMTVKIQRSYNSLQPYTWPEYTAIGVGWTMSFGWVEIANVDKMCNPLWSVSIMDNPVLHMPDGSVDVLAMTDSPMADMSAIHYRGKGGMGIICGSIYGDPMVPFIMMGPDGTRYEFERWSAGGAMVGFHRTAKWFVKRVTDKHGNWIEYEYEYEDVGISSSGAIIAPVGVTASDGREIFLEYDGGLLQRILFGGLPVAEYEYEPASIVGSYSNLVTVTLREGLTWNYEYSSHADPGAGSMTRAMNPYGGVTEYTWQQMYFQDGDGQELNSAVVQVTKNPIQSPAAVWAYAYTPARNIGERDITTVMAPEGIYVYRHFSALGMVSGEVWKVGLRERVTFTPNDGPARVEEFIWSPYLISQENNKRTKATGLYAAVDQAYYGPLLAEHVIRIGLKEWRTTQSDWWWESTFIGNPQAQTITMISPTGEQKVLNRRYEHRNSLNIFFLLHQEWITQSLFPNNTPMRVDFDALGNPVRKFEKGFYTHYSYDADGNLASETHGLGGDQNQGNAIVTGYSDYFRGLARRVDHPDGTVTSLVIDPHGRVTGKTDRDGNAIAYAYDEMGRVTQIDYPIGNDVSIAYAGRVTALERGSYRRTTVSDGFGRSLGEIHADIGLGNTIQVNRSYDEQGRNVFTSYPNSMAGNAFQYDDYGRITRVTHPGGHRTYVYVDGEYVEAVDESGNLTRFYRDEIEGPGKGDLVRIGSPEGIVTTISRNEYGLPLQISQGNGSSMVTRINTYSPSLVLLESTGPELSKVYFSYDLAGNVTSIFHETSPGFGRVQNNGYDENGRLISVQAPLNETQQAISGEKEYYGVELAFSYTAEGKPVDQVREETVSRYQGSQQTYISSRSSTWHHEYDQNGNLLLERLTTGDGRVWQFSYSYNANDHRESIIYPDGYVEALQPNSFGWPTQAGTYATNIQYHATGQLAGFTYGNGKQLTIALNNRFLINAMQVSSVSEYAYEYDALGNVLSITNSLDPVQNSYLHYDDMGRLVSANGDWGMGSFEYDFVGNITRKKIGSDDVYMGYDSRNRLVSLSGSRSRQYSYDTFGNVSGRNAQQFGYDGLGNLMAVPALDSLSGGVKYQYDARGRRLAAIREQGFDYNYTLYAGGNRLLYEVNPSKGTWKRNIFVGNQIIGFGEKYIACHEDIDGDGIPHCAELEAGLDPYDHLDAIGDMDGDGLGNLEEFQRGTAINNADTDGDGVGDGVEVLFGLNPNIDDAGGDMDGDGLPNLVEIVRGLDPSNPSDGAADADSDGLSNAQEYALGTDWQSPDTDGDGIPDAAEVLAGLNPLVDDASGDQDGDGLPNWWEIANGLNPNDALDASMDPDGDGVSTLAEFQQGSNPLVADVLPPVGSIFVNAGGHMNFVSWLSSPYAQSYTVDYGVLGEPGVQSSPALANTSFVHEGVQAGVLYWYSVRARNAHGESQGGRIISAPGDRQIFEIPSALTDYETRIAMGPGSSLFVARPSSDKTALHVSVYRDGQWSHQDVPAAMCMTSTCWDIAVSESGDAILAWSGPTINFEATAWAMRYSWATDTWGSAEQLATVPVYTYRYGYAKAYADEFGNFRIAYARNWRYPNYYSNGQSRYQFTLYLASAHKNGPWTSEQVFVSGDAEIGDVKFGTLSTIFLRERRYTTGNGWSVIDTPEDRLHLLRKSGTTWSAYNFLNHPNVRSIDIDRDLIAYYVRDSSTAKLYAARICGNKCLRGNSTPFFTKNGAYLHGGPFVFDGSGQGQVYWTDDLYRLVYKTGEAPSSNTFTWSSGTTVIATDAWNLGIRRSRDKAYFLWGDKVSEVMANGTWTEPVVRSDGHSIVRNWDIDVAGNLAYIAGDYPPYTIYENRHVSTAMRYQDDMTPPMLSQSSVRSGASTVQHAVTLGADEPANLFFSVSGGTVIAGGASTTDEQRYTGPVTITFPAGSSATITYRGINMAELWSNPVSTVLQ